MFGQIYIEGLESDNSVFQKLATLTELNAANRFPPATQPLWGRTSQWTLQSLDRVSPSAWFTLIFLNWLLSVMLWWSNLFDDALKYSISYLIYFFSLVRRTCLVFAVFVYTFFHITGLIHPHFEVQGNNNKWRRLCQRNSICLGLNYQAYMHFQFSLPSNLTLIHCLGNCNA